MKQESEKKYFSSAEALLPVFFYSYPDFYWAAVGIPLASAFLFMITEIVRRSPPRVYEAVYFLMLLGFASVGWIYFHYAPYWIWSVYLLTVQAARAPSIVQRALPFGFGFRKYAKRRTRELSSALIFFGAGAFVFTQIKNCFSGSLMWLAAIAFILFMQVIFFCIRRKRI